MKKLFTLFITVFLFAALANGQNTIITTKGDTLTGTITTFIGKTLTFTTEDDEQQALKIENVSAIFGQMPTQRGNAIKKANPLVIINTSTVPAPVAVKLTQARSYNEKTPGDLIQISAKLRLAGFIIPTAVTTIGWAKGFDKVELKKQRAIYVSAGVVGIALYIAGEATQIKAGKLMNKNKNLSFAPASEGIGIALKF